MDILDYIPQRPPFVMIDEIVAVEGTDTTTSFTISAENVFAENGEFYEGGIIENIAQTIAAGAGYRLRQNGGEPKMGVIASIRKLALQKRPQVGSTILTKAELMSDFGNALVVKGTVECEGENIASCQMNVFIIDQPDTLKKEA